MPAEGSLADTLAVGGRVPVASRESVPLGVGAGVGVTVGVLLGDAPAVGESVGVLVAVGLGVGEEEREAVVVGEGVGEGERVPLGVPLGEACHTTGTPQMTAGSPHTMLPRNPASATLAPPALHTAVALEGGAVLSV
jgi:hypothetical protein